jgi:hypothetical protein
MFRPYYYYLFEIMWFMKFDHLYDWFEVLRDNFPSYNIRIILDDSHRCIFMMNLIFIPLGTTKWLSHYHLSSLRPLSTDEFSCLTRVFFTRVRPSCRLAWTTSLFGSAYHFLWDLSIWLAFIFRPFCWLSWCIFFLWDDCMWLSVPLFGTRVWCIMWACMVVYVYIYLIWVCCSVTVNYFPHICILH